MMRSNSFPCTSLATCAAMLLLCSRLSGADASGAATVGPTPGADYGFGAWSTKTDPRTLLSCPDHDADIGIEAFHWVVSPKEIHGIIRLRHLGDEPVGLVERWNSWGAFQWHIVIDGHQVLSNPQRGWTKNFFRETVIKDRDTWIGTYSCCFTGSAKDMSWTFWPNGRWTDTIIAGATAPDVTPFAATARVQVVLDGQAAVPPDREDTGPNMPRMYQGRLCATSAAVAGNDKLKLQTLGPDHQMLPLLK